METYVISSKEDVKTIKDNTEQKLIVIDKDPDLMQEILENHGFGDLSEVDAILIPGGFGERGTEGMIAAVKYARESGIPYLGICLGLQIAVIEYARNVLGLSDAHSTEFKPDCNSPVIALVSEWTNHGGDLERRDVQDGLGGTMRLGAQDIRLIKDTMSYRIYDNESISERHRHRYEVNDKFVTALEDAGLVISGWSQEQLVEIIELSDHPWFLAVQFHPEFKSTPRDGHPLFSQFVDAACIYRDTPQKKGQATAS